MESTVTALPVRSPWGQFPGEAEILAKESGVKSSLYYPKAKTGGTSAAVQLVFEQVPEHKIRRAMMKYRDDDPIIAPVHGIEAVSDNVIPLALAASIADVTGFEMDRGNLVQTNRAGHTGASGWHRIANPALFSGDVEDGRRYILVDDFLGMGGTFANMKGYIESKGGIVIAMVALTGKPRSRRVALRPETLKKLRDQYGKDFETWWETVSGADFSHLTEAEALYLVRAKHADTIRDRIAEAKEGAGD